MIKISYHDCKRDMEQTKDILLFARDSYAPAEEGVSSSSRTSRRSCGYLFFPGCRLCGAEPEIVIKIYDSILFQHPDTAILVGPCGSDAVRDMWLSLGKPVVVTPCMKCMARLREGSPDMEVLSLYQLLLDMNVSGGCNSASYTLFEAEGDERYSADDETKAAIIALAEDMGASISQGSDSQGSDKVLPYLTCCIDCRDSLKKQGQDAVHILELIYGMGDSNAHMEHEHDHGDSCGTVPETEGAASAAADHDPADGLPSEEQRLANIRELITAIPALMR